MKSIQTTFNNSCNIIIIINNIENIVSRIDRRRDRCKTNVIDTINILFRHKQGLCTSISIVPDLYKV